MARNPVDEAKTSSFKHRPVGIGSPELGLFSEEAKPMDLDVCPLIKPQRHVDRD